MNSIIIYICALLLFSGMLSAQCNDSLLVKKLLNVNKYSYPICKEKQDTCFGYGSNSFGPGPIGQISSLIIQNDSVIVVDSYFRNLIKINLQNGKIVRESKPFKEEGIGSLREILYFNKLILVLSEASENIYIVNNNLSIKKIIKIPLYGYLYKFFYVNKELYALSNKTVSRTQNNIDKIAFKINSDISLTRDTISLNNKKYLYDTLLYGRKVQMLENSGHYYLLADSICFEIPEIISQLNYYDKAIGYNNKYLVYFVRNELSYEMVVCKYEE